jgi:hypothetical protein
MILWWLLLLLMVMVMSACRNTETSGLCGPALGYSWSFCVRTVRRVIVGKVRYSN